MLLWLMHSAGTKAPSPSWLTQQWQLMCVCFFSLMFKINFCFWYKVHSFHLNLFLKLLCCGHYFGIFVIHYLPLNQFYHSIVPVDLKDNPKRAYDTTDCETHFCATLKPWFWLGLADFYLFNKSGVGNFATLLLPL